MAFCNKCGYRLKDDDIFCPKCGNKIDIIPDSAEPSEQMVENEVPGQSGTSSRFEEMTYEESIKFTEKLKKQYASLEKTESRVKELERTINTPIHSTTQQHSFFRYFWPSIIIAVIGFTITYIIGFRISLSRLSVSGMGYTVIIAFIIALIIILVGVKYARTVVNSEAYAASEELRAMSKHKEKAEEELTVVKAKYFTLRKEIAKEEVDIPSYFRNSAQMGKLNGLLVSHKASSITEAMDYVKKPQYRASV